MHEIEIYKQLLELLIEDMESDLLNYEHQIKRLEEEIELLNKTRMFQIDKINPYDPPKELNSSCPKCGIALTGVMSYSCPNIVCPVGLGPVYCKT